jgi:3,4-dihydroxy-2-butanone 4-phosphate synthase
VIFVTRPCDAGLCGVEDAVAALAGGETIVVVDSTERENERDLVMAADAVMTQAINFMAKEARASICVPLREQRLRELDIPPMRPGSSDAHGTAFHVSVDLRKGTSTGISARDRAATIAALSTRPPRRAASSSRATCSHSRIAMAVSCAALGTPRRRSTL